ncbi:MAG: hypothetical protein ABJP45_10710 [Cyclobacteriaceae bacterium]
METSILIARILAVVYLSVGFGLLFNPTYYKGAFEKLIHSPAYRFLGGWIAVSVGVVMVQYHNLWVNDWRAIITIVAWIALIKGIFLIVMPQFINDIDFWFKTKRHATYTTMYVLLLGVLFGWLGFFN